jgi:NDP-sugar pyrophosphorylase family protein
MMLAAGFGTRLRPLTEWLPKPVVPVANRPLIEYNLRLLQASGIEEVAINLHHLGEEIRRVLGDGSGLGIEIVYSPEEDILGTGGGLVKMRPFLQGGTFILMNADILTGVDLSSVLRFHRERRAVATMVVRPYPSGSFDYTPLVMDQEGRLVEFKEVRREPRGGTRPVLFTGVHVLEPEVFDHLPASGFSCVNTQGYSSMLRSGLEVAAFLEPGPWYDLGDPALYLTANRDLLAGRLTLGHVGRMDLKDAVLLGERVEKGAGVQLGPEVAVGDDCVLGAGASIARSVVWPGSEVEPGARLDNVIVANNRVIPV